MGILDTAELVEFVGDLAQRAAIEPEFEGLLTRIWGCATLDLQHMKCLSEASSVAGQPSADEAFCFLLTDNLVSIDLQYRTGDQDHTPDADMR